MIEMKAKVAIISSNLLGDSVVFLTLANNLAQNGFDVYFYSKMLESMSDWVKDFTIKGYNKEKTESEIDKEKFDVILADSRSVLGKRKESLCDKNLLSFYANKKYLFFGFSQNQIENLIDDKSKNQILKETLQQFVSYSNNKVEVKSKDDEHSMVQHIALNCMNEFNLKEARFISGLIAPESLIKNKNNKRILIHPYSSTKKHDWNMSKFIKLAKLLKRDGWEVEFVSSPKENSLLKEILKEEFKSPIFEKISDLAQYIYESRAIVSNDSGNVHLASAIGIESFVIGNKMKGYTWRPGYGFSTVINPRFILKLNNKKIWKMFLSFRRVYKTIITKLG